MSGKINQHRKAEHDQKMIPAQVILAQIPIKKDQLKPNQHQAVGGVITEGDAKNAIGAGNINALDPAHKAAGNSNEHGDPLLKKGMAGNIFKRDALCGKDEKRKT